MNVNIELDRLKRGLSLAITKKGRGLECASIAYSKSGMSYIGANVQTQTHLLDMTSEQVALLLAIQNKDYAIEHVVTLIPDETGCEIVSPITQKILIDFVRRSNTPLSYTVINDRGTTLFEIDTVESLLPEYKREKIVLSKIHNSKTSTSSKNVFTIEKIVNADLKKYAFLGMERHFPAYDGSTSYGCAVYTKQGNMYISGQYSSFDKRLNVHSEMGALTSAFMNNDFDIIHIGVVSEKFKVEPVNMCGCCRQFLFEMSERFSFSPTITLFAKESNKVITTDIKEYLPHAWSSNMAK